jgi:hypothetical protein
MAELLERQVEAFRAEDLEAVRHYDMVLSSEVGRNQVALSSLQRHIRDHKCQPNGIRR